MRSHINSLLLALSAVLMLSGSGYALDYDFSGNLQYHNNILQYTFTTNGSSNVTLFSSSWDDGNFDPMLGLWRSDGSLIQWQDDGHVVGTTDSNGVGYDHGNWDSYFSELLTSPMTTRLRFRFWDGISLLMAIVETITNSTFLV